MPILLAARQLLSYALKRDMKTLRKSFGLDAFNSSGNAPDVIVLPDANALKGKTAREETQEDPERSFFRRTMRKRFAVLLAAIAVPAMAAPGDFGALPGAAPTEAEIVSQRLARQLEENPAMPFEKPGMSFPGSAFFFLADPPSDAALIALPTTDARDIGAAEGNHELGELIETGPAANPFFTSGGLNHDRARQCLAQAIWYEAASESEAGQRAVAQVVLNRVAHSNWPGSVCGVVYQGSHRNTGCQFTFTCDGSLARRASGSTWVRAQRIAGEALSGSVYAPVGYATHYHTLWVNPYWASSLDHVGTIGAHRFYRNRGAAGQKGAFGSRYTGFEPSVSGRTSPALPSAASAQPEPITPAYRTERYTAAPTRSNPGAQSAATSDLTIEPVLANPSLSSAGQAREEYARAGQWKSDAARQAAQEERQAAEMQPPERQR